MPDQPEHTPTPWRVENGSIYSDAPHCVDCQTGPRIATMDRVVSTGTSPTECDANARHIVRAVNAHAGLVEALRAMLDKHDTSDQLLDPMYREGDSHPAAKLARQILKNT